MWWKATLCLFIAATFASTTGDIIDRNVNHDNLVTIPSVTNNPVQHEVVIYEATEPSAVNTVAQDSSENELGNHSKPGDDSDNGINDDSKNQIDADNDSGQGEDKQNGMAIDDDGYNYISLPQVNEPTVPSPSTEDGSDSNGFKDETNENGYNDEIRNPVAVIPDILPANDETGNNPEGINLLLVETTHGPVKGFYRDEEANRIRSFYDIPYGSVGLSLFVPPTEPNRWEDALQNEGHTVRCLQMEDTQVGALECLTLSVFAPENAQNAKVLFHIHNSEFDTGSGDPNIYGPEHLIDNDVIVVLPNYRLGLLGFLCLQNDIAPGNAGLKDLTLALQWTRSNIEKFGGNPLDITVSGFGAAGALASYLAISPKSKDYVSKVIVESGSVFAHWAIDRDPLYTGRVIHQKIGNKTLFTDAEIQSYMSDARDVQFKPCIETGNTTDAFLSKSPWEILQDNTTEIHAAFMIGSANLAGTHEALRHNDSSLAAINANFSIILPNDLHFPNEKEMLEIANRVKQHYFGESTVNAERRQELALCYTDASYLVPLLQTARMLLERGATVYLYEFSYLGDFNRERNALGNSLEGAVRGDVIGYVFTQDGQIPGDDTEEKQVLATMVHLWTTFIKNGKPEIEGTEWPELTKVNDTDEEFLAIGSELVSSTGLHVERMRLWTQIYEDYFIETSNFATSLHTQSSIIFLIFTVSVLMKNLI